MTPVGAFDRLGSVSFKCSQPDGIYQPETGGDYKGFYRHKIVAGIITFCTQAAPRWLMCNMHTVLFILHCKFHQSPDRLYIYEGHWCSHIPEVFVVMATHSAYQIICLMIFYCEKVAVLHVNKRCLITYFSRLCVRSSSSRRW